MKTTVSVVTAGAVMALCAVIAPMSAGATERPTIGPPVDLSHPADTVTEAANYDREVKLLFKIAVCGGDAEVPGNVDKVHYQRHCRQLTASIDKFRTEWVDKVIPFMANIKPADLPTTVVYPFGGGDLVGGLATYPNARDLTTISLEWAGDPRVDLAIKHPLFTKHLDYNRDNIQRLFKYAHSRTDRMLKGGHSRLPGQLVMTLAGLRVHKLEPISLRYFVMRPDGTLDYVTPAEIETELESTRRNKLSAWEAKRYLEDHVFRNMEIEFKAPGEPNSAARVFRHIATDCQDKALKSDNRLIAYLSSKGTVAAMTKAASYLLWWEKFSEMRAYLLGHMAWMVSDSTGIPAPYAEAAGFEQITWGTFEDSFLESSFEQAVYMRHLWMANPFRPLDFFYGYPDKKIRAHLMVTRPVPGLKADVEAALRVRP